MSTPLNKASSPYRLRLSLDWKPQKPPRWSVTSEPHDHTTPWRLIIIQTRLHPEAHFSRISLSHYLPRPLCDIPFYILSFHKSHFLWKLRHLFWVSKLDDAAICASAALKRRCPRFSQMWHCTYFLSVFFLSLLNTLGKNPVVSSRDEQLSQTRMI